VRHRLTQTATASTRDVDADDRQPWVTPALDNIDSLRPRGRQTPGLVERWLASAALRVRVWAERNELAVLVWTCVMAVGITFVIAGLARLGWSLGR
jgi:hypothetical protein